MRNTYFCIPVKRLCSPLEKKNDNYLSHVLFAMHVNMQLHIGTAVDLQRMFLGVFL